MNKSNFDLLIEKIREVIPDAEITPDLPDHENGHHWLNVSRGNTDIPIEWRPVLDLEGKPRLKHGFGFFASDSVYGEGPNIIVESVDEAFAIVQKEFVKA